MKNKDVLTMLKSLGLQTKANEVMNTGNAAAGQEFIPDEVFSKEIFDLVPQRASLLNMLPGNHGNALPKTYTAPVIGLSVGDVEFEGRSEWTTGTASETENDHSQKKAVTQSMTLTQKGFIAEIDISDDQLRYNAVNTEQYVKDRLVQGMIYTVEAAIINGDSETGATGNVNLDDAAPAASKYYLKIDGGVRERAINGSYTKDFGTLDIADFNALKGVLGEYDTNSEDVLFITGAAVKPKITALAELLTVDKYGANATVFKGVIGKIQGSDVLVHRAVPKTEADGKVSTTAGNNVKGQILALYKAAVQYGFGKDLFIEVVRVPGYGYRIVATFDFAFTIVDAANSLTQPTVAAGINITL